MVSILFIEDDPAVAEAITLGLNRLGHNVSHRPDGNGDFDDAWVPRTSSYSTSGCRVPTVTRSADVSAPEVRSRSSF